MILSKKQYISGCQCEKMLWLRRHKPEVCNETETEISLQGQEVGELARRYFPYSITVKKGSMQEMADKTKELMALGKTTICEATFCADGLGCSTDIVRITPEGLLVIEVKSSIHMKDVQIDDIAFQCHVIRRAGFKIAGVYLMHPNAAYVFHKRLKLADYFAFEDIADEALRRARKVAHNIERFTAVCDMDAEPQMKLSINCDKPYACPCRDYCFAQNGIPEVSVFNIPGMSSRKKYELYSQGIITQQQLLCSAGLTEREAEKVANMGCADDKRITVNREKVREFLSTLRYPIYQLDFETFQQVIPSFEGVSPYSQIPFQYSLHIVKEPCGAAKHREFLGREGKDPRRCLAEHLCRDIPYGVQSMAYNYSFEKSVCRTLAAMYPDLANHLLDITKNMVDLMVPFQKGWVTSPALLGSYSIKRVLPLLCGDDPELDYHRLPVVHNGEEAASTFASLARMTDSDEIARIREGLLLYCGLDTLAMVKILEKLYWLAERADDV